MEFILAKNFFKRDKTKEPFENIDAKNMIKTYAIPLLMTAYAMYLGWNCTKNLKNNPFKRFFWMLIYFLFSGIYLLYYFVAYYMAGKSCFD